MLVKKSKYLLFALLFLSLVNVYYFYSSSLPDHIYSIGSGSNEFNYITYYSVSFFATLSYFLGPFILICTSLFLLLYPAYFKKSNKLGDIFIVFSMIGFIGGLCFYILPSLLGNGLENILSFIGNIRVALLTFLFSFVFFLGLAGWSLKNLFSFVQRKSHLLSKRYFGGVDSFKGSVKKGINVVRNPSYELISKVSESLKGEESYEDLLSIDEDDNFLGDGPKLEENFFENKNQTRPLQNKKVKKNQASEYISQEQLIKSIEVKSRPIQMGPDQSYFETIITCIEEKLEEFKIHGKIINVIKGPVVDTFELELGPGIKVSKVTSITEDLSLALSGAPIRMVYPLKGRTTMGIEVPRNPREIIYLSDVLKSQAFRKSSMRIPIGMGKDAFGESRVVDLAAMPHMLVAGATGAGKSVFINTLLVSLLVRLDPKVLKLILIDPKQLELALYSRLPHLIMPVVTEAKIASIALLWATQEMERRYSILKEMGVRNVEGFNEKVVNASQEDLSRIRHFYDNSDDGFKLPYIVVIVDEFADLILTKVGKDIEINICRLAAKARASGIHLVLATQRPSVDVITGLIKSNFPTRVSFRVTSSTDSRTILNSMGAEKLLGKGDMLFKQGIEMHRMHASYVDENEIERLIEKMCVNDPEFDPAAMEFIEEAETGEIDFDDFSDGTRVQQTLPNFEEKDPFYNEAVEVIRETRAASASMLQRRLKVGYNRAANLIEQLEKDGIVGPQQGSKPRKVMI
jgi:S-DNA-T family DNA segregation ATPase FtsK/SpoIIIE